MFLKFHPYHHNISVEHFVAQWIQHIPLIRCDKTNFSPNYFANFPTYSEITPWFFQSNCLPYNETVENILFDVINVLQWLIIIIIIIIINTTMFMVLSSWQSHCESSPGSFDECRTATSSHRPKTKPDDLWVCLYKLPVYTHHRHLLLLLSPKADTHDAILDSRCPRSPIPNHDHLLNLFP